MRIIYMLMFRLKNIGMFILPKFIVLPNSIFYYYSLKMFKPGSCIRKRYESIKHKEIGTYVEER
jgi:hypothetical protein